MKILLTGSSSGIGKALYEIIQDSNDVHGMTRTDLDLSDVSSLCKYEIDSYDMVIHCAGTGVGGKLPFAEHDCESILDILTTNLLAPVVLTNKILCVNPQCKIVYVTSTNNKHYYPYDLAYSLSKASLSTFIKMLLIDYPQLNYLEVQLGLTKTNFNNNRYKNNPNRFVDIYQNTHLDAAHVAQEISRVLFNKNIKFIEISP